MSKVFCQTNIFATNGIAEMKKEDKKLKQEFELLIEDINNDGTTKIYRIHKEMIWSWILEKLREKSNSR